MRYAALLSLSATVALMACSSGGTVVVDPQAGIVGGGDAGADAERVWVCHQGRWQEVAAPAADAHRGHGDRVSAAPREPRAAC